MKETVQAERPITFLTPEVQAIIEGRKKQTRRVVTDSNSQGNYRASELLLSDPRTFVDKGPSPAGNPGPYLHAYLNVDAILQRRGVKQDAEVLERLYPRFFPRDVLWVRETWQPDPNAGLSFPEGSIPSDAVVYAADLDGNDRIEAKPWRPSIHMPRWAARLFLRVEDVRVDQLINVSEADIASEGINPPSLENFAKLWDKLNGKRAPWESNPRVWVVTFSVIKNYAGMSWESAE